MKIKIKLAEKVKKRDLRKKEEARKLNLFVKYFRNVDIVNVIKEGKCRILRILVNNMK